MQKKHLVRARNDHVLAYVAVNGRNTLLQANNHLTIICFVATNMGGKCLDVGENIQWISSYKCWSTVSNIGLLRGSRLTGLVCLTPLGRCCSKNIIVNVVPVTIISNKERKSSLRASCFIFMAGGLSPRRTTRLCFFIRGYYFTVHFRCIFYGFFSDLCCF